MRSSEELCPSLHGTAGILVLRAFPREAFQAVLRTVLAAVPSMRYARSGADILKRSSSLRSA